MASSTTASLLRERIASNAGLAGEQEVEGLASNENIVVSVPGNTRFFIVLLEGSGQKTPARTAPAGARGTTQVAANGTSQLPSAEELRELIELKAELNRMYQDVAATRTAGTTATNSANSNLLNLRLCSNNTGHPPNSRPICGKLGAREGHVQPRQRFSDC